MKRPIRIEGDLAYISLTRGYVAVIDAADVPLVDGVNWCAVEVAEGIVYGYRQPQGKAVYLHRVILGLEKGDPRKGDHIDRNTMNCRRSNLRIATAAENARNRGPHRKSTHGHVGVHQRRSGRWEAYIHVNSRRIYLGSHSTLAEAARARDIAARRHHGEFAYLNNPVL